MGDEKEKQEGQRSYGVPSVTEKWEGGASVCAGPLGSESCWEDPVRAPCWASVLETVPIPEKGPRMVWGPHQCDKSSGQKELVLCLFPHLFV